LKKGGFKGFLIFNFRFFEGEEMTRIRLVASRRQRHEFHEFARSGKETVETVEVPVSGSHTLLKQGVNEN